MTLRWVVGHLIEETARHVGHLDITRELVDGRTGREASVFDPADGQGPFSVSAG